MDGTLQILLPLVIIGACVLIGSHDFRYRRIENGHVALLLSIAVIYLLVRADGLNFDRLDIMAPVIAVIVFVLGLIFWSIGKMGGGDVKFLSVTPLLIGSGDYIFFLILTVIFSIITHVLMNMPVLMPKALFEKYVENYSDGQLIPYGVPISTAVSVMMVIHLVRMMGLF